MDRLLRLLVTQGLRKGLLGGHQRWLAAGIAAYGVRKVRQASSRKPEVVYRAELEPGQSLLIDHTHVRHGDM